MLQPIINTHPPLLLLRIPTQIIIMNIINWFRINKVKALAAVPQQLKRSVVNATKLNFLDKVRNLLPRTSIIHFKIMSWIWRLLLRLARIICRMKRSRDCQQSKAMTTSIQPRARPTNRTLFILVWARRIAMAKTWTSQSCPQLETHLTSWTTNTIFSCLLNWLKELIINSLVLKTSSNQIVPFLSFLLWRSLICTFLRKWLLELMTSFNSYSKAASKAMNLAT